MRRPLGPAPAPPGRCSSRAPRSARGDRVFRRAGARFRDPVLVIMGAIAVFLVWRRYRRSRSTRRTSSPRPSGSPIATRRGLRDRGPRLRHAHDRRHRDGAGRPGRLRDRPVHRVLRDRAGSPPAWPSSSTCSPPCPSIIFGLWGLQFLHAHMAGLGEWLNDHLGFIPLFANDLGIYTRSIAHRRRRAGDHDPADDLRAISARSSARCPRAHVEAALALGATRWEMVRIVGPAVLPPGHDQRGDARARPCPRRDHRCRSRALGRLRHQLAHHRAGRQHLRSEHRAEVERGRVRSGCGASSRAGWCCSPSPSASTWPPG